MPKVAPHVFKRLGELLHDQFNEIAAQPLPERWVELIHHLNQQERDSKATKQAT